MIPIGARLVGLATFYSLFSFLKKKKKRFMLVAYFLYSVVNITNLFIIILAFVKIRMQKPVGFNKLLSK